MGTLKKTARLWCFQSPGRSRTEAEHHTKQFLRQLPTRKPAGVIPTAQTHPLHWLVLATALLCFPCTQVRRFPLRAGKQALGEEKAGEKKNPNHSQHPNKVQPRHVVRLVLCSTQLLCSCQLLSAGERRILIALQSHP